MGVDHLGRHMSFDELMRQVRQLAVATIQNSAVGRAGIRFYDAGKALFQGGGGIEIQDSGYIIIDGDMTGAGDFDWTGSFNQEGASTFTGPTTFTGTINATGNTAWSGTMSILGDVIVLPGGKIQVGNITIDPTANGGSIKVGAHSIYVNGAVFTLLHSSGSQVVMNSGGVALISGGKSISLDATGISMTGLPTVSRGSAQNAVIGTLWMNTSGQVFRVVT